MFWKKKPVHCVFCKYVGFDAWDDKRTDRCDHPRELVVIERTATHMLPARMKSETKCSDKNSNMNCKDFQGSTQCSGY